MITLAVPHLLGKKEPSISLRQQNSGCVCCFNECVSKQTCSMDNLEVLKKRTFISHPKSQSLQIVTTSYPCVMSFFFLIRFMFCLGGLSKFGLFSLFLFCFFTIFKKLFRASRGFCSRIGLWSTEYFERKPASGMPEHSLSPFHSCSTSGSKGICALHSPSPLFDLWRCYSNEKSLLPIP